MITLGQLIERIRIIAITEPDFIYNNMVGSCTYLPNRGNQCGCIVGEALVDLGVDSALLQILDEWAPQGIAVSWGSSPVISLLGAYLEIDALGSPWVRQVQSEQDDHRSWSTAVHRADDWAEQLGWVKA